MRYTNPMLKHSIHGQAKEQIQMAMELKLCSHEPLTSCICKQATAAEKHNSLSRVLKVLLCRASVQRRPRKRLLWQQVYSNSYISRAFCMFPDSGYGNRRDIKIKLLHILFSCETTMCWSRKIIMTPLWAADVTCMGYNPRPDGLCESVSIMSKSLLTQPAVNEMCQRACFCLWPKIGCSDLWLCLTCNYERLCSNRWRICITTKAPFCKAKGGIFINNGMWTDERVEKICWSMHIHCEDEG